MPHRLELSGLALDVGWTGAEVLQRLAAAPALITYLNPLAWKITRSDPDYAAALARFDLVLCDGIAIQRTVRARTGLATEIISLDFSGIAAGYLALWRQQQWRACLVGALAPVVEAAARRLQADYPDARLSGAFSGHDEGPGRALEHILAQQPELVLCGMGMGRQEAFLLRLRDAGWQGRGIAVGGFFDKLARPGPEYPDWALRRNLRFLARILDNPVKFIPRYTIDYIPFMKWYIKSLLRPE